MAEQHHRTIQIHYTLPSYGRVQDPTHVFFTEEDIREQEVDFLLQWAEATGAPEDIADMDGIVDHLIPQGETVARGRRGMFIDMVDGRPVIAKVTKKIYLLTDTEAQRIAQAEERRRLEEQRRRAEERKLAALDKKRYAEVDKRNAAETGKFPVEMFPHPVDSGDESDPPPSSPGGPDKGKGKNSRRKKRARDDSHLQPAVEFVYPPLGRLKYAGKDEREPLKPSWLEDMLAQLASDRSDLKSALENAVSEAKEALFELKEAQVLYYKEDEELQRALEMAKKMLHPREYNAMVQSMYGVSERADDGGRAENGDGAGGRDGAEDGDEPWGKGKGKEVAPQVPLSDSIPEKGPATKASRQESDARSRPRPSGSQDPRLNRNVPCSGVSYPCPAGSVPSNLLQSNGAGPSGSSSDDSSSSSSSDSSSSSSSSSSNDSSSSSPSSESSSDSDSDSDSDTPPDSRPPTYERSHVNEEEATSTNKPDSHPPRYKHPREDEEEDTSRNKRPRRDSPLVPALTSRKRAREEEESDYSFDSPTQSEIEVEHSAMYGGSDDSYSSIGSRKRVCLERPRTPSEKSDTSSLSCDSDMNDEPRSLLPITMNIIDADEYFSDDDSDYQDPNTRDVNFVDSDGAASDVVLADTASVSSINTSDDEETKENKKRAEKERIFPHDLHYNAETQTWTRICNHMPLEFDCHAITHKRVRKSYAEDRLMLLSHPEQIRFSPPRRDSQALVPPSQARRNVPRPLTRTKERVRVNAAGELEVFDYTQTEEYQNARRILQSEADVRARHRTFLAQDHLEDIKRCMEDCRIPFCAFVNEETGEIEGEAYHDVPYAKHPGVEEENPLCEGDDPSDEEEGGEAEGGADAGAASSSGSQA